MSMNLNWVITKTDDSVIAKKTVEGVLTPYHVREGATTTILAVNKALATGEQVEAVKVEPVAVLDRASVKTIALQDEEGKEKVSVDVPEGAEVFQRHRVVKINFNNKFVNITQVIPASYDEASGIASPEKTVIRSIPETTYQDVYLIGYRVRVDKEVQVFFKALYPDGKIEEYTAFGTKAWLYEPEWFPEETV
jgi:hypothetical protein